MALEVTEIALPFSGLRIAVDGQSVVAIDFIALKDVSSGKKRSPLLTEICRQLGAYSKQKNFTFDLPLAPGGTDFQQSVWRSLRSIGWGEVKTYGQIAQQLGTSPRAVGNACRHNPLPLLIPCHRVLAQSGIGGYAGDTQGGYLAIKQHLLFHEGHKKYHTGADFKS